MLGLTDLKQTRFYQEAFADGRQEGMQQGVQQATRNLVRRSANLGNSPEAIAQFLGLPLEEIRQILQSSDEERS